MSIPKERIRGELSQFIHSIDKAKTIHFVSLPVPG